METSNNQNGNNSMEREALHQFRKNLSDVLTPDVSDAVLLKWLRTNSFNVRKCVQLYKQYTWTKQVYKTDDLEKELDVPEVIEKYEFASHLGMAKDGTPVLYIAMGKGDLKGFLYGADVFDIGRYCSYLIETDLKRCREQSKKLGKEINDVTYIVDMDQFALSQLFFTGIIELGLDMLQLLQDHYPEIWNKIIVINAPFYFQTIFNIFKPILRLTFLQKIYVVSREHSEELLLKYIDPEVLPVFIGGKRFDSSGNEMCNEFMKFGGTIPEELYLRNTFQLSATDKDVEDVWIPPRGSFNYPFVVREADSIVRIEYRTEGGSVGGSIVYKEFDDLENIELPSRDEHIDETDESNPWKRISPYLHVQAHVSPVNSYFYAPWPGIYVAKFDNMNSWLTSKRTIFRVRILPPGTKPI